ncbi:hypothetical protein L5515_012406 [Caenorhabditis briggsae]|uniref:SCP domain-containing protein n=1 Tax=Caenorhabditis briggsae TaxID=6238 RepID=A0AAE9EXJ3_CAEBR|nr:hypothetical protein L5515_012406 [Caenorhabditis briggsae]
MKFILYILVVLGFASAQFNETAQEAILKAHNDLRSAIAKGEYRISGTLLNAASNMRKMKWDLSLAEKAQNVTDSCPDNINTGDGYGENVLASYVENPGKALEITLLDVEVWKMQFGMRLEDLLSLNGNIQNYELTKTTQMAWAEIDSIGCGFSNCGKKSSGSKTKVVVACMYKISSSRISQEKPYKSGETCSSCDPGFTCDTVSGLCAGI